VLHVFVPDRQSASLETELLILSGRVVGPGFGTRLPNCNGSMLASVESFCQDWENGLTALVQIIDVVSAQVTEYLGIVMLVIAAEQPWTSSPPCFHMARRKVLQPNVKYQVVRSCLSTAAPAAEPPARVHLPFDQRRGAFRPPSRR
jgi:hypothetical protein